MRAIHFSSGKSHGNNFGKLPGWRIGILLTLASIMLGCGSASMTPVSPQAPQILTQPANQGTRVGQTATFAVLASGTAPLRYQWSKNGTPIVGATSPSYTTAAAIPGDNAAVFAVTVTNSIAFVNSNSASLKVGARAPQIGDLRFQQVATSSTTPGLKAGGTHSDVVAGLGQFFGNDIGTPLTIGTGNCGPGVGNPLNCVWFFSTFGLPSGIPELTTNYQGFNSNVFPVDSELRSLVNGRNVFTSLDLELSNNVYAASWVESASGGGFQYFQQTVSSDQFQAVASQLGQQSRVITAVSFDISGDVYFVNYGWASDVTTPYEVKTAGATAGTLSSAATNLANSGYIITALGGNSTNGFLLVGTRVQGDSLARPVMVVTPKSGTDLDPLMQSGDAIVGLIVNADFSNTYIGEQ
ncbi:MAG: hypothetical protein ACRD3P_00100 [Terriglobales bacterium]